eukprot:TRINITY_DN18632_c0_g1_i1.p2 TRINITY_DN18632_c0_g1~~TRINITY_DN18632_c0_g1_i1.p2  ORF type:complete len:172 (-),score=19.89 TRINITY_DN18632_c0_g1_i1:227-712(-)
MNGCDEPFAFIFRGPGTPLRTPLRSTTNLSLTPRARTMPLERCAPRKRTATRAADNAAIRGEIDFSRLTLRETRVVSKRLTEELDAVKDTLPRTPPPRRAAAAAAAADAAASDSSDTDPPPWGPAAAAQQDLEDRWLRSSRRKTLRDVPTPDRPEKRSCMR